MKTIKILIWILNITLLAYLGFTFSGTALMKHKDVAQVEAGNQLFRQMIFTSSAYFQKETFNYLIKRLKEYNFENSNSFDNKMIQQASQIKSLRQASLKNLEALPANHSGNLKQIHSLLADYEQKIKVLDTSFHKLGSLNFRRYKPLYSQNPLFQKTQSLIFQCEINQFYQNAIQRTLYRVCFLDVRFDKTIAMTVPKESIITENEEYHADLLLVNTDFHIYHVHATLDGKPLVPKESEYYYPIASPATADNFDENGECKKTWKAAITIANALKDTTYIIEREYIIKKKK